MTSTVLVVDDDADLREAIAMALMDEGFHSVGASNGADALARLRTGPTPDLIILDLMMPVMDGWAFREAQQRDPALASIPVLVLSASRHAGMPPVDALDHLYKPVDLEVLLAAVGRLLARA
jgi:CheY-like chemotaxis protein